MLKKEATYFDNTEHQPLASEQTTRDTTIQLALAHQPLASEQTTRDAQAYS
jgi:hypothetical protein